MITLSLIGIGMGGLDHMTGAAIARLRAADLVLVPHKGDAKSDLADMRREICDAVLGPRAHVADYDVPVRDAATGAYLEGVLDWHEAIAGIWAQMIRARLGAAGHVAVLVWGDPSLYDSTLRIADRLGAAGVEVTTEVVPGVTSLQYLCAAHAIALNTLGGAVMLTTGRNLRDHGWPLGVDTVAVMLDGGCAFQTLPAQDFHIWWGGYVGMPEQILRAGPLADVGADIIQTRAKARAQHGWIMDIYLLRRREMAGVRA